MRALILGVITGLAFALSASSAETPAVKCTFAGLDYSVGAQIQSGQVCQADGTWAYPEKAPTPADKG